MHGDSVQDKEVSTTRCSPRAIRKRATCGINQTWTITPTGSYYKVVNRANGKALDTGGGAADGNVMQFWFSNESFNQQWTFEFVSSSTN